MNLNNPAARLHSILTAAIGYENNANALAVWAKVLNTSRTDKALLLSRFSKVYQLVDETILAVKKITDLNTDKYLHWHTPVLKGLAGFAMNGNMNSFNTHITAVELNALSFTADLLCFQTTNTSLEKSSIESIITDTKNLIAQIQQADIPNSLKSFMLEQLYKVQQAANEHFLSGSAPIDDVVNATFGHGVLNAQSVELAKTSPVVKSFWQYMANIAVVITIATGAPQLAPPVMKLLPELNFDFQLTPSDKNEKSSQQPALGETI